VPHFGAFSASNTFNIGALFLPALDSIAIATLQQQENYLKTGLGSDNELNIT